MESGGVLMGWSIHGERGGSTGADTGGRGRRGRQVRVGCLCIAAVVAGVSGGGGRRGQRRSPHAPSSHVVGDLDFAFPHGCVYVHRSVRTEGSRSHWLLVRP